MERQEREKLLSDFREAGEQITNLRLLKRTVQMVIIPKLIPTLEAYDLLEEQLVSSQMEVEAVAATK